MNNKDKDHKCGVCQTCKAGHPEACHAKADKEKKACSDCNSKPCAC